MFGPTELEKFAPFRTQCLLGSASTASCHRKSPSDSHGFAYGCNKAIDRGPGSTKKGSKSFWVFFFHFGGGIICHSPKNKPGGFPFRMSKSCFCLGSFEAV